MIIHCHQLPDGARTYAWYRGPFTPVVPHTLPVDAKTLTSEAEALVYAEAYGVFDVGYASVIGAHRIAHGQMTIGSLIAFLTYFTLILFAVMMATFVGVLAPRAAVSGERIQEVLDTEPSVTPSERPVREQQHRVVGARAVVDDEAVERIGDRAREHGA